MLINVVITRRAHVWQCVWTGAKRAVRQTRFVLLYPWIFFTIYYSS